MSCPHCVSAGKHMGIKRKCALDNFNPETGDYNDFSPDNSYCKSFLILRSLTWDGDDPVDGIQFMEEHGNKYATFSTMDVVGLSFKAHTFWMSWLKEQGQTTGAWLLGPEGVKRPIQRDILNIIEHYRAKEAMRK